MKPLSADKVLTAWEYGQMRHPVDRALLLISLADPKVASERLCNLSIGQRNLALLKLRQVTFGNQLRAYLDCPSCNERLEFNLEVRDLMANVPKPSNSNTLIEVNGLSFRIPTSSDLALIAQENDTETAALKLLHQCLVGEIGDEAVLLSNMKEIEAAMEEADPLADLSLDFCCDACGHRGVESFDIVSFVWEELDARARALFDEIHLLARNYGWSESDILAMSESRRAAYLERVTA